MSTFQKQVALLPSLSSRRTQSSNHARDECTSKYCFSTSVSSTSVLLAADPTVGSICLYYSNERSECVVIYSIVLLSVIYYWFTNSWVLLNFEFRIFVRRLEFRSNLNHDIPCPCLIFYCKVVPITKHWCDRWNFKF